VTGDRNVEGILDDLNDLQLQQAKVAALDRGDKNRVDMIDAELAQRAAQRASLNVGLGNAFDSLPYESRERVVSAASGGMVAFADGGDVDPFAQFSGMDPAAYAASVSTDEVRRQSILNRRKAEEDQQRIEFLRTAAPEVAARMEKERKAPASPATASATASAAVPYDRATATRREDFRAPPRESGFSKREASNAVNTIVQAAKVQVPEDRTEELTNTLYSQMMARTKADRDSFRAELETVKGRAKEIEARGIGEALAKFGFGMAASAAKPGRRQGLAGVIEAGATASPLLAESLAETQKLKAAAQDNYMKMRVENARYESAVDQGNMQLAATLANNIGQRKLAQATLQEQIAQHERMYGLEKEKLGIQRAQAGKQGELRSIASELMAEDPSLTRKSALQEASRIAGYSFRTDAATGGKLASELRKIDEEFSTLKFLDPKSKMAENLAAQRQQRISEAYRLYGTDQPGGVTSAQPPAAGAGQMRIVGVR